MTTISTPKPASTLAFRFAQSRKPLAQIAQIAQIVSIPQMKHPSMQAPPSLWGRGFWGGGPQLPLQHARPRVQSRHPLPDRRHRSVHARRRARMAHRAQPHHVLARARPRRQQQQGVLLDARLLDHDFKHGGVALGVGVGAQYGDVGAARALPSRFKAVDDLGGGQGRLQEEMGHVQLLDDWRVIHWLGVALIAEEVPAPAFAVAFEFVLGAEAARDVLDPGPLKLVAQAGRSRQRRVRHLSVFADVRGQMQRPARAQPAGQQVDCVALNQAAALMALLEPGIGIVNVKLGHCIRPKQVGQRRFRATVNRSAIAQAALLDFGFGLVHGLAGDFEADDVAGWPSLRQVNQVVAVAEADLDD